MADLILLGSSMLKSMILNGKSKRGKDEIAGIQAAE